MLPRRRFVFAGLICLGLLPGAVACVDVGPLLGAEPSKGMPPCEEFYDMWEARGAPAELLAMAGFGREVMAASDCLKQNEVALACEHWKKLLPVIDKTGPPLNENRGQIEGPMRQHQCDSAAPAK